MKWKMLIGNDCFSQVSPFLQEGTQSNYQLWGLQWQACASSFVILCLYSSPLQPVSPPLKPSAIIPGLYFSMLHHFIGCATPAVGGMLPPNLRCYPSPEGRASSPAAAPPRPETRPGQQSSEFLRQFRLLLKCENRDAPNASDVHGTLRDSISSFWKKNLVSSLTSQYKLFKQNLTCLRTMRLPGYTQQLLFM